MHPLYAHVLNALWPGTPPESLSNGLTTYSPSTGHIFILTPNAQLYKVCITDTDDIADKTPVSTGVEAVCEWVALYERDHDTQLLDLDALL